MKKKQEEPLYIKCPQCGKTSYNPSDIEQRYCGNCHAFHDALNQAAEDKAQELYGPNAHAEMNPNGLLEIHIGESRKTWRGWPPLISIGWGDTWEQAFELAAVRSEWTLPAELKELGVDPHDERSDAGHSSARRKKR